MGEQCPICGYRYECPCGCQGCPHHGPQPTAGPSLVAGAIGRGLGDAAAATRRLFSAEQTPEL